MAVPGFLMVAMDQDFTLAKILAEGGGGTIFTGTLTNPSAILRNNGKDSCSVKLIKGKQVIRCFLCQLIEIPDSSEEIEKSFLQEVAIMWLFSQSRNFVKVSD